MSDIDVKLKPVSHTLYHTPFGTSCISRLKTMGVIALAVDHFIHDEKNSMDDGNG